MKQKTRFKIFGNIGIGLKKAISVNLYSKLPSVSDCKGFAIIFRSPTL